MAIEALDGVAAGIFSVIAVIIADDLIRGTGRFNLAQGLVALSVGVGAALSNLTSGFLVQWFGSPERVSVSRDDRRVRARLLRRLHARNPACRGDGRTTGLAG